MSAEIKLENRRKKLIFRSWHRGTREMDLMLGRFADSHVAEMAEDLLDHYERLLQESDPNIYNWIAGRGPAPQGIDEKLLKLIKSFRYY